MNPQPPIPEPLWGTVSADARAALVAAWNSLQNRIAALEARVCDLEARLQLNSTDSSKPPSSDPIGLKRKPPAPPSRRKRGGQPGHPKAFRALVPPEKLHSSRDCKPSSCRRCGQALHGVDPKPLIHQVAEPPQIEPIVDEYRLHRRRCPDCGTTTCASLPEGVPGGGYGPYLQAVSATLAGAYRSSKRPIQQLASDLFGLSISTGMISKLERQSAQALEAPYNELAGAVHTAEVIHADETSWREDRDKAWLWATVAGVITVFTIARKRNAQVAKAVLGAQEGPIAVTDRWSRRRPQSMPIGERWTGKRVGAATGPSRAPGTYVRSRLRLITLNVRGIPCETTPVRALPSVGHRHRGGAPGTTVRAGRSRSRCAWSSLRTG